MGDSCRPPPRSPRPQILSILDLLPRRPEPVDAAGGSPPGSSCRRPGPTARGAPSVPDAESAT